MKRSDIKLPSYRNFLFCLLIFLCLIQEFGAWKNCLHAAEFDKDVKKSIAGGVNFLKENIGTANNGYRYLSAYALLKAGVPADNKVITDAVQSVLDKVKDGKYNNSTGIQRYYEAGVSIMLLVDATGKKHLPEIKAIVDYFIAEQHPNGAWNYTSENGDTSVTQYAVLGLWSASRVGVEIPNDIWGKILTWHVDNQAQSGGFAYTPGVVIGQGEGKPTLNMSFAGVSSMLIIREQVFPDSPEWGSKTSKKKKKDKYGVLTKIEVGKTESKKKKEKKEESVPPVSLSKLDAAIRKGIQWANGNFRTSLHTEAHFPMYYYYTTERMGALSGIDKIGGRDWYKVCAEELFKRQLKDGAWTAKFGKASSTSFALLFLSRSTAKIIGRPVGKLGTGLLAGGRGLPDNLGDVSVKGGKIDINKSKDPLAELLAELEKPNGVSVDDLQTSVVEKIQIGDPEELLGQRKKLIKLATNKNADIRRVALWALGRTGNISDARLMVDALGKDDNIDVLIEARNALCYMSHKANGFGSPTNPFHKLTEEATQKDKDAAMAT